MHCRPAAPCPRRRQQPGERRAAGSTCRSALAPMITVTAPVGNVDGRGRRRSAARRSRGSGPRPPACAELRVSSRSSSASLPAVGADQQPEQVRRADAPVTTPTGSSDRAAACWATRSAASTTGRRPARPGSAAMPATAAAGGRSAARRTRRRPSARRPRWRRRPAPTPITISTQPRPLDPDAEARGGVVAEMQRAQRARTSRVSGTRTAIRSPAAALAPSRAVEAADQPAQRDLGVPDVGPGHQVGDARRRASGAEADADQHQPVARHAAPPGEQRRSATAVTSAPTKATAETGEAGSAEHRSRPRAALAPEVMPMMSGLASGLRTMVWKIAPDMPKATPTSSPMSARGSRSSLTMKSVARSPRPNREERPRRPASGSRRPP